MKADSSGTRTGNVTSHTTTSHVAARSVFLALLAAETATAGQTEYNLCYVSLNNEREFTTTKAFVEKIRPRNASARVNVIEFQTQGANPEETLAKLLDSGIVCDGLVLSGHNSGVFGGDRASSPLSMEAIERLSCRPHHQAWFEHVKTLWLQGCRTLGAPETPDTGAQITRHLHRIGHHTQTTEETVNLDAFELERGLSTLLDNENPFAGRLMRAFPAARVLGWTGSAPGRRTHSERSLPDHIASINRLARHGLWRALLATLTAESNRDNRSCPDCVSRGWIRHGPGDHTGIAARAPLFDSDDPALGEIRDLNCRIVNAPDVEGVMTAMTLLDRYHLPAESSVPMIFDALSDATGRFQAPEQKKQLRDFISASSDVPQFIRARLASPDTGLSRKIDYFAFLRDMPQSDPAQRESLEEARDTLRREIIERLSQPIREDQLLTELDFRTGLVRNLLERRLLDNDMIVAAVRRIERPQELQILTAALAASANRLTQSPEPVILAIEKQDAFDASVDVELAHFVSGLAVTYTGEAQRYLQRARIRAGLFATAEPAKRTEDKKRHYGEIFPYLLKAAAKHRLPRAERLALLQQALDATRSLDQWYQVQNIFLAVLDQVRDLEDPTLRARTASLIWQRTVNFLDIDSDSGRYRNINGHQKELIRRKLAELES